MNQLMGLFLGNGFPKCTYTPPKAKPSVVLSCLPHHNTSEGTDVLQSSVATCPVQVQALSKMLQSCGLARGFDGGIACSTGKDGTSGSTITLRMC